MSQDTVGVLFLELSIQDFRVRRTMITLFQNPQLWYSPLSLRAGQMNISRSKCQ